MKRIVFFIMTGLILFSCGEEEIAPDETEIYLDELMDVMETNHIYRNEIDWDAFRKRVIDTARMVENRFKKITGVRQAITLLDDHHSYLIASNGRFIGTLDPLNCESVTNFFQDKPDDIGYVRVTRFSGTGEAGVAFAQAIQTEIKAQDSESLKGWIVDLRRNTGGNMYPMLAGIGPILGEGTAGYFVYADNSHDTYSYRQGEAYLRGESLSKVDDPYELINSDLRVAVLLDEECGSSGEAIATAFSGRENTRSFGQPTCGVSTGIAGFDLSDGSALGLAICFFADRNRKIFENGITPDELTDPEQTIQKATEWIRSE